MCRAPSRASTVERGPGLENARSIHPAFAVIYTLNIFALICNTVFSLFYSTVRRPSHAPSCRLTRPWWKKLSGRASDHLVLAVLRLIRDASSVSLSVCEGSPRVIGHYVLLGA